MTAGPIAVVSDLHLEPECADDVFAAFERALEEIRARDPARLVVLGDVVQETSPETDRRLLQRLVDRLEELPFPSVCLRGNHDVECLDPSTFGAVVGHDRYQVDPDSATVSLDSSAPRLPGGRGEIDRPQLGALADALETLENAIVFVHHPVHYRSVRDNYWFSEHPEEAFCGNKRAVREILEPAADRIAAVVSGHLHEWHVARTGGLVHVSVDAFNKRLHPTGETGGFAVIERDDGLSIDYYAGDGTERHVRFPK